MSGAPSSRRARPSHLALHRAVWRWHFYAGLLSVPFILALALSGGLYLFKPQIEAWLDRGQDALVAADAPGLMPPHELAAAALAAVPGARFEGLELRAAPGDAARILVRGPDAAGVRRVYLHPVSGEVRQVVVEAERPMAVLRRLHGALLMGKTGRLVAELTACWAFVLVATGLWLWWPRGRQGLAGVLWPRLRAGGRAFWRDLHAVTGVWVSGLALVLLATALPWTTVWGGLFREVRGLIERPAIVAAARPATTPDWSIGGEDEHAHHAAPPAGHHPAAQGRQPLPPGFDRMVAAARAAGLAPPALIYAPEAQAQGRPPGWIALSETQNRPLRAALIFDPATGAITGRSGFADRPVVDRIVGYGIALHEGQLFGWLNQALGVLAALGLAALSVSGAVLWWKRRPQGTGWASLAAPPPMRGGQKRGGQKRGGGLGWGLTGLIAVLALVLPLLGASLLLLALAEWAVLRRWPAARRFLGIASKAAPPPRTGEAPPFLT